MSDLIKLEKSLPPEVPDDWAFEKADKNFDDAIYSWRRLTDDIIRQLWFFYLSLPRVRGRPKKNDPNGSFLPTWREWLKAKGLGINTPLRHFYQKGWLSNPEQIESPQLPAGKYFVLYADPPWRYESALLRKEVDAHYPTMDLQQLVDLGEEITDLAYKDAVLLMWATTAKLNWAFPVMDAWGFEYKTSMVWDKVDYNMGYYWSQRHEILLVGGRGSSTPTVEDKAMIASIDFVQSIPKSKIHSEKPEEIREIIDLLWPGAKKIELFARKKVKGWDAWGYDI